MADNYLEKRMEDYRNGKLGVYKKKKTDKGPVIFIAIKNNDKLIEETVKNYRQKQYRVAFCHIDRKTGAALAQQCGARFYPVDSIESELIDKCRKDIISHWGGINEEVIEI